MEGFRKKKKQNFNKQLNDSEVESSVENGTKSMLFIVFECI